MLLPPPTTLPYFLFPPSSCSLPPRAIVSMDCGDEKICPASTVSDCFPLGEGDYFLSTFYPGSKSIKDFILQPWDLLSLPLPQVFMFVHLAQFMIFGIFQISRRGKNAGLDNKTSKLAELKVSKKKTTDFSGRYCQF